MKLPFIFAEVAHDQTYALRCSLYDLLPPMHADAPRCSLYHLLPPMHADKPWYGMAVSVVGVTKHVYTKITNAAAQATLPREFDGEVDAVHTLLALVNVFARGLHLSDVDGRPWRRNTFYFRK